MENGEVEVAFGCVCHRVCPGTGGRGKSVRRPDGQRRELRAVGDETHLPGTFAGCDHVVAAKKECIDKDSLTLSFVPNE